MNKLRYVLAVCAVAFLMNAVGDGETEKKEPTLGLTLTLSDGSRVIGTPRIASIRVQTSYAKMDIPLKQIQNIKIEGDHETASLTLTNGDKLKGVLDLKPLELETSFGRVAVNVQYITGISVYQKGKGSLASILKDGLVLYYSFDEDEGRKVTDQSGQGHDGTVKGATWVTHGISGGAYNFDGSNKRIDTGFSFGAGMDEFSASLWMMDTKGTGEGVVAGIDFTVSSQHKDYVWGIFYGHSTHQFWVRARHPDTSWVTINIPPPSLNTWEHLVVTFKRNDYLKFYQNGVLVGQQATEDGGTMAGTTYTAGLAGTPGSEYDGCNLDEVRFYNRVLSEDEVKTLYNSQN